MSSSNTNAKMEADSYIGSFISLISKYEIRYEGVLYILNVHDSTIGLKNVKSYGTEGRKKDGPQIPASDKVYEYILFRGSDIKDLEVKSSPPQKEEQIPDDPAIIQSQYSGTPMNSPSLASIGGKNSSEASPWQDTPALITRNNPPALPAYMPVTQSSLLNPSQINANTVSPSLSNPSQVNANAGSPSFSTLIYQQQQGYGAASVNISNSPQFPMPSNLPSTISPLLITQTGTPASFSHASPILPPNASGSTTNVPASFESSSLVPSSLSFLPPVQSSSAPELQPTNQNSRIIDAHDAGKAIFDPVVVHSTQTALTAAPSMGSASGPSLTPHLPLLMPNQIMPARPAALPSMQNMSPDKRDMSMLPYTSYNPPFTMANLTSMANFRSYNPTSTISTYPSTMSISASFDSPSVVAAQPIQTPLLPLPVSATQSQNSINEFREEFDFEAMNEKFKKDEVWGYLGKEKKKHNCDDIEDDAIEQWSRDKAALGLVKNIDAKPAYEKDDFFDTISCNSLSRGTKDGQNRFSERMKLDTETFGNFRQRSHQGYGGYSPGQGQNYGGTYGGGRRGYSYGVYGGRGRGGYMNN